MALVSLVAGCRSPTNQSNWSANQAVLPWSEFNDNLVTVHNIRNTVYRSTYDYTVHHYDQTFDLNKLDSVDYVMTPLDNVPGGAHTFLTFGFDGKDYVAISVEVRRAEGEEFSALRSMGKPYELMYVVGDERDLIQVRSITWLNDVYMYQANARPEQMRALFVDMLKRANKLRDEPEFYNLVTNNCTTNIMRHINNVAPGTVPYGYEVLFPKYSDRLAYQLGLIRIDDNFERTRQEARINEVAYIYREDPQFSVRIREYAGPALARRRQDAAAATTTLELSAPR
ncbi:MAG: DUF4105 domain-containing protein [Pirellulales bacterium]